MFKYFHKNKLKYQKGQLTPFFIVFLVVLVIMALVTVNIAKVAMTRTDASNAVDAGALAGGAVMANLFNAVAQANSGLITAYEEFIAVISVTYGIATTYIAWGMATVCIPAASCAASAGFGKALAALIGIGISIVAFHVAQLLTFESIETTTIETYRSAQKIALQLAFSNSGIGSKLKDGSPPANITDPLQKHNYREEFTDFIKTISDIDVINQTVPVQQEYRWKDGQDRLHYVQMNVQIQKPDKFMLTTTLMPFLAETAAIGLAAAFDAWAWTWAFEACKEWTPCCLAVLTSEVCCPIHEVVCALAEVDAAVALGLELGSFVGLAPTTPVENSWVDSGVTFIICWIDDIIHDRKVTMSTLQHHMGKNYQGIWNTQYPDTTSWSLVSFEGSGSINEPKMKFDADIIQTD